MPGIELQLVTSTLITVARPLLQRQLPRQEIVQRVLKVLQLQPDTPHDDFDEIYVRTLIEYGLDKHEIALKLFRQPEIRSAFRESLTTGNRALLINEAEEFLDWNILGDECRRAAIDPRREFDEFTLLFHATVDKAKTPTQIELGQQINKLLALIPRLATIDDIRTEVARATSPLELLAQQLRNWFSALGYIWDTNAPPGEDRIEWLLHVPTRRGYDRITLHATSGEGSLSHVQALRQASHQYDTDEAWLISPSRIRPAAREAVTPEEARTLYLYTFDELIDESVDFTGYINWLQSEIRKRRIDELYVPPSCTKDEYDLDSLAKIGVSRFDADDGWIDRCVNQWLEDPQTEHLSILGEFGTGKTWFALHYTWQALNSYLRAKATGMPRPRIPLYVTLRDYSRASNIEFLF